jgi:hypothetical protein
VHARWCSLEDKENFSYTLAKIPSDAAAALKGNASILNEKFSFCFANADNVNRIERNGVN